MRFVGQGNRQHFLGRRHFEVEWEVGRGLNALEIGIADMSTVFAQMRGDAIAAHRGHDFRRPHRIGMIASARVADGGDVVDIDPQAKGRAQALRLPGLVTSMAARSSGNSSSA